jgi:hypothetical protein
MTQASIDYYKRVTSDVRQKYGVTADASNVETANTSGSVDDLAARIPMLEKQFQNLERACVFMKNALINAPDSGGFTSVTRLLSIDGQSICEDAKTAGKERKRANMALEEKQREERKKGKDAARAAERAASTKRREAIEEVLNQCGATVRSVPCVVDGITDDEKAACERQCTAALEAALKSATMKAVDECVTNKKKPPACNVQLPEGHALPPGRIAAANLACAEMCTDKIKEASAPPSTAAEKAPASAPRSPASRCANTLQHSFQGSNFIINCDEASGKYCFFNRIGGSGAHTEAQIRSAAAACCCRIMD